MKTPVIHVSRTKYRQTLSDMVLIPLDIVVGRDERSSMCVAGVAGVDVASQASHSPPQKMFITFVRDTYEWAALYNSECDTYACNTRGASVSAKTQTCGPPTTGEAS